MDDFHIIESENEYGIARDIRIEGDSVITKQTYDAEPMLEAAHAARIKTAGDRWNDGHFIGVVPMAELTRINAQFQGSDERKAAMVRWLKANPAFVTFDKFLK